jgi:hypothetical protein
MTNADILNAAETLASVCDGELPDDTVKCLECGQEFKIISVSHLKTHNMTMAEYREKYPETLIVSQLTIIKKIAATKIVGDKNLPLCECGCGLRVTKPGNRFISGHNSKGREFSEDHKTKITKSLMGHKVSDKTKKLISKAHMGKTLSDEHKAILSQRQKENPQSGTDIVYHHYIYDHSDLSKYTMKMTQSTHTRLHNNMRKAGIKVPHINVEEDEGDK